MTQALERPPEDTLRLLLADTERLKELPIETVERLVKLSREMAHDMAKRDFAEAFNRVQSAMSPVRRTAKNTHTGSMYARAEHVSGMLDPILAENGFSRSLSTVDCPVKDHLRIMLLIRHASGHDERHFLDAPIDDKGIKGQSSKTRLHGMASSMTYAERHLLCHVFGVQLVADDDGNAGTGIGPGHEPINDLQLDGLLSLMEEVKADEQRFLNYFKVKKMADLPAGRFKEAIRMLEKKR